MFTPEELNNLADGLNSILQSSNPRGGWPFRLTLKNTLGCLLRPVRCLPEPFPRDNYCKKDGRCPHRLRTPTARLQARKRSARRIAIAQRSRAAVAPVYPAMSTGCGLLTHFADAHSLTQHDPPCGLLALAANDTGDKRSIVACAATLAAAISAITGCPCWDDISAV